MATAPGMNAAILRGVGAPVTPTTVRDLAAWQRAEGGSASFNPFNTTQGGFGGGNYNSVGVKSYPNAGAGVRATIATLNNGRYGGILGSLRQGGDPSAFTQAIANSPWGTSGALVAKILGAPTPTSRMVSTRRGAIPKTVASPNPIANWLLKQGTSLLNGGYGQSPQSLFNLLSAPSQGGTAAPVSSQTPSRLSGSVAFAGGFLPSKALYTKQRADQGRDLQTDPGGPIISPGLGKVVRIAVDPNGFGTSYPIVHFQTGPYAGKDIYIGHTKAAVKQGQTVYPGDILGHTGTTGNEVWNGNATKPGWAEIGFAPDAVPGAFGQTVPF